MSARPPVPDPRNRARVERDMQAFAPGYTGTWAAGATGAAAAINKACARYVELLISELNEGPDRGMLAFLDTFGERLLPAQSAQAAVVFKLSDSSPVDVSLLPTTQVASQTGRVFTIDQPITVARAKLVAFYCTQPGDAQVQDQYGDYSAVHASGFTLFAGMQPGEHAIYLGHDQVLALPQQQVATVILSFPSVSSAPEGLQLDITWEYLAADGWRSFDDPSLQRLIADGQIALKREGGPASKADTIGGVKSYWIRGTLNTPLPQGGTDGFGSLPTLNQINVSVAFTNDLIPVDAAFTDGFKIDPTNAFRPFGATPSWLTTFYIACQDALQRKGAIVSIAGRLVVQGAPSQIPATASSPAKTAPVPTIVWEYFDGTTWSPLDATLATNSFTKAGGSGPPVPTLLTFRCPEDIAPTKVNGTNNLWIRGRFDPSKFDPALNGPGPYGSAATYAVSGVAVTASGGFNPPTIDSVTFAYSYLTDPTPLDHLLATNNFLTQDHTVAAQWPRNPFVPFQPLADAQPCVYLGFDDPLPVGLVSLYFHAVPDAAGQGVATSAGSPFTWEYLSATGWTELDVDDGTSGFRQTGMIQFIGPWDAVSSPGLGGTLYRIRARLKSGEETPSVAARGIWLNAVGVSDERTYQLDILGTSDGNPSQAFLFLPSRCPVLEGQVVEVREWAGGGVGWEMTVQGADPSSLRFVRDPGTNAVTEVWVRWTERDHLYASGAMDRDYTLERVGGTLRVGDGSYGMIPPGGALLAATYSSGGGLAGNVPAASITQLRATVPYVQSVTNPLAAGGGTESESLKSVRVRGPQRLRHGGRAVAPQDFEWLAREASPAVARARCLAVTGPDGRVQTGWVTLVIVPFSDDAQPAPDPELELRVRDYVAARAPATVASRVRVVGTQYRPVSVVAQVVPVRAQDAAALEVTLRQSLQDFLHPIHGGPDGQGWQFGDSVYLSQIAQLIEGTPGVDYASELRLQVNGEAFGDVVPGTPDTLVASGAHEIRLTLGGVC